MARERVYISIPTVLGGGGHVDHLSSLLSAGRDKARNTNELQTRGNLKDFDDMRNRAAEDHASQGGVTYLNLDTDDSESSASEESESVANYNNAEYHDESSNKDNLSGYKHGSTQEGTERSFNDDHIEDQQLSNERSSTTSTSNGKSGCGYEQDDDDQDFEGGYYNAMPPLVQGYEEEIDVDDDEEASSSSDSDSDLDLGSRSSSANPQQSKRKQRKAKVLNEDSVDDEEESSSDEEGENYNNTTGKIDLETGERIKGKEKLVVSPIWPSLFPSWKNLSITIGSNGGSNAASQSKGAGGAGGDTLYFPKQDEITSKLPQRLAQGLIWRVNSKAPRVVRHTLTAANVKLTNASIAPTGKIESGTSTISQKWLAYWGKHLSSDKYKNFGKHQVINHFPLSFEIGRKDKLWNNYCILRDRFGGGVPEEFRKAQSGGVEATSKIGKNTTLATPIPGGEFNYIPETFILPRQAARFERVHTLSKYWILKPPASARGIGIRIVASNSKSGMLKLLPGNDTVGSKKKSKASTSPAKGNKNGHSVKSTSSSNSKSQSRIKNLASSKPPMQYTGFPKKASASAKSKKIHIPHPLRDSTICSRYIPNPLLINDKKFDLRIYVAVTSFEPLRVYIYRHGLARFASEPYHSLTAGGSGTTGGKKRASGAYKFAHLTNYSINKKNKSSVNTPYISDPMFAEDGPFSMIDNKWSLETLAEYFKLKNLDYPQLHLQIQAIILKTIMSVTPKNASSSSILSNNNISGTSWNSIGGNNQGGCRTYELFGFDVLVDTNLKAWLMEVNISPALKGSCDMDYTLKRGLVADLFNLVGFGVDQVERVASLVGNHRRPSSAGGSSASSVRSSSKMSMSSSSASSRKSNTSKSINITGIPATPYKDHLKKQSAYLHFNNHINSTDSSNPKGGDIFSNSIFLNSSSNKKVSQSGGCVKSGRRRPSPLFLPSFPLTSQDISLLIQAEDEAYRAREGGGFERLWPSCEKGVLARFGGFLCMDNLNSDFSSSASIATKESIDRSSFGSTIGLKSNSQRDNYKNGVGSSSSLSSSSRQQARTIAVSTGAVLGGYDMKYADQLLCDWTLYNHPKHDSAGIKTKTDRDSERVSALKMIIAKFERDNHEASLQQSLDLVQLSKSQRPALTSPSFSKNLRTNE